MNKLAYYGFAALLLSGCVSEPEQQDIERDFDESRFESSNLPIVVMQTNHESIPDEPKILTKFTLINSPTGINQLDETNELDYGFDEEHMYVGMEVRGYSSQDFPKQQYGIELWTANEGLSLAEYEIGTTEDDLEAEDAIDDQAAELLGMGKEEDWILYAPYSDKSLMRNVLAYSIANDISDDWHPQAKYVEMFFTDEEDNLDYRGVYLLTEKIKRDKNRVDINKLKDDEISGEDLTGGYLLEITGTNRLKDDEIAFKTGGRSMIIAYPKPEGLQPEQQAYIEDYVSDFTTALYSEHADDEEIGYQQYIDMDSFVEYLLVNELFKNRDAFSFSTYFHKEKNEKLKAGPVWDFNASSGNDNVESLASPTGWTFTNHWIASGLYNSPAFIAEFEARWKALREDLLSDEALIDRIQTEFDKLNQGAATRNFEKWDILGRYITFNGNPDLDSHEAEVAYLRDWMLKRVIWIDANITQL